MSIATASTSCEVIEDIHEQLICAICLERFEDPKFLSCLHTFCSQCIHKICNQEPTDYIVCPTCREHTPIPEAGIDHLKSNFFANSLLGLVTIQYEEIKKEKQKGEICENCMDTESVASRFVMVQFLATPVLNLNFTHKLNILARNS